jgi:alpha-1,2-mannosyltransferase
MVMEKPTASAELSRWERYGLVLLLAVVVAFGVMVEVRTAFLKRRMGDLGVYLRAAWAVRTGADFYEVTDDNTWHYNYPPLFAILLAPLADPPPGLSTAGMLPWAWSAGIWYVLNILCLAVAVHWLASALEQTSALVALRGQPAGTRAWWALRVMPILVCLVPIGHTLMRGQANLILLALLCGMAAGLLRGQRFRAGMCLAGMICIKVFPAYLALYPLWRRDVRCLSGCAVGLLLGMVMIPLAVFGPAQTVRHYEKWAHVLLGPALGVGDDQSRATELIRVVATDTQAFQATIHNTIYRDRATRPVQVAGWVRVAHWLIGAALTGLTLLAARRRRIEGARAVLLLGALTTIMLLLSPVCHLHNLALSTMLVGGLVMLDWERTGRAHIGWGLTGLFALYLALNIAPQFPGMELTRDLGLAMYGALLLWLMAVVKLWRTPRVPAACGLPQAPRSLAA